MAEFFKNYCNCGGYAWSRNGRPEAQPHTTWCAQHDEYAERYAKRHPPPPPPTEKSMRVITDHVTNPANENIGILVLDQPGAGGASHLYQISGFDTASNPSDPFKERYGQSADHTTILFQNGPIKENGVNGITQEVLLAIVADRLRSFQAGPYSCRENSLALTKVEEALHWLQSRTLARTARGVEGTSAK